MQPFLSHPAAPSHAYLLQIPRLRRKNEEKKTPLFLPQPSHPLCCLVSVFHSKGRDEEEEKEENGEKKKAEPTVNVLTYGHTVLTLNFFFFLLEVKEWVKVKEREKERWIYGAAAACPGYCELAAFWSCQSVLRPPVCAGTLSGFTPVRGAELLKGPGLPACLPAWLGLTSPLNSATVNRRLSTTSPETSAHLQL